VAAWPTSASILLRRAPDALKCAATRPSFASNLPRCAVASRTRRLDAAAHRRIARIDAALASPSLFGRDPRKATSLAKARAAAADALGRAENEWIDASAALEAAMA